MTCGGRTSECILPAALKTRSTPADDAGAEKYCLTILVRRGQRGSLACREIGVVAKMKERLRQAIGGRLHQPCALPAWLAAGIAHPASPVPA